MKKAPALSRGECVALDNFFVTRPVPSAVVVERVPKRVLFALRQRVEHFIERQWSTFDRIDCTLQSLDANFV